MTIYYISPAGNDTTGDGSSGNRWATFTKAFTVAVAGDSIRAADGVYAENTSSSGYWSISKNLAGWLTVEAENGAAGDVTIRATSGTIQNTLIAGTSAYLCFKYIKFGALTGTRYNLRFNGAADHLDFQNCTFVHSGFNYENVYQNAAAALTNITFTNCTFSCTGTQASIFVSPTGGASCSVTFTNCTHSSSGHMNLRVLAPATITIVGGTHTLSGGSNACIYVTAGVTLSIENTKLTVSGGRQGIYSDNASNTITLTNVTITSSVAYNAIDMNGGTVTISGCTVTHTGNGKCYCLGVDAASGGNATTVSITGCVAVKSAGTGHAVLVGNGATGTVDGMRVMQNTSDFSLVVKENTAVTVKNCQLVSGTSAALYFKATTNAVAQDNVLSGRSGGAAFQLAAGDTGNKSSGCILQRNLLRAQGASNLINWITTGDGDNNSWDRNRYQILGSGSFGTVRATANIATLAALQSAWSGYTNPANDANSVLYAETAMRGRMGKRR